MSLEALYPALTAAWVAVFILWLVSLKLRDVSIIDIWWAPGFALVAWVYAAGVDHDSLRGALCLAVATIVIALLGGRLKGRHVCPGRWWTLERNFMACGWALFAGGVDLLASRLVGHPKHLALPGDAIELRSKVSGVVPRRGAWAARVASFFQDARAETKLGRGLAACAAIAAHVAVAAAFVGATGASSGAAFACLLALVLLFAAQFGTLLGGSGRLVFRRADMENVDATRSGEAEDVGDSEASRGGGASRPPSCGAARGRLRREALHRGLRRERRAKARLDSVRIDTV